MDHRKMSPLNWETKDWKDVFNVRSRSFSIRVPLGESSSVEESKYVSSQFYEEISGESNIKVNKSPEVWTVTIGGVWEEKALGIIKKLREI